MDVLRSQDVGPSEDYSRGDMCIRPPWWPWRWNKRARPPFYVQRKALDASKAFKVSVNQNCESC